MKAGILFACAALALVGGACGSGAGSSSAEGPWTDDRVAALARQISNEQSVSITTAECIAEGMSKRFLPGELISKVGDAAPTFNAQQTAAGESVIRTCVG